MSKKTYDAFISHNSREKDQVRHIVDRLRELHNIECWFDEQNLTAGEDWAVAIERELNECKTAVVVLGAQGWGSYHLKEAQFSLDRIKRQTDFLVIPVLLPGASDEDMRRLGDFFDSKHRVEFKGGEWIKDGNAFQRLSSAVKGEATGPQPVNLFVVKRDAQRWAKAPQGDKVSMLLRGAELREARRVAAQYSNFLDDLDGRYLSASEEEEQRVARQDRRRLRRIIAGLSVGLALVAVAALIAVFQRAEAVAQRELAQRNLEEAVRQRVLADKNAGEREEQRKEAVKQEGIAKQNEKTAKENEAEAQRQEGIAKANEREARSQQARAERGERAARRQSNLALARTLAVIAEHGDIGLSEEKRGILARQAFLINRSEGGPAAEIDKSLRTLLGSQHPSYERGGHDTNVTAFGFSDDGRLLASGGEEGVVALWDLTSPGTPARKLTPVSGQINSLAVARGGRYLAGVGESDRVSVWDLRGRGTQPFELVADGESLGALASPGEGLLATGAASGRVLIWELADPKKPRRVLEGLGEPVTRLAVSRDGTVIAAGGAKGAVGYWRLGQAYPVVASGNHPADVIAIGFDEGGRLQSVSSDGVVLVSEIGGTQASAPARFTVGEGRVDQATFTRGGRRLAFNMTGKGVRLWEVGKPAESAVMVRAEEDSHADLMALDAGPGDVLALGRGLSVRLMDLNSTNDVSLSLPNPRQHGEDAGPVTYTSIAFSPDGNSLALSSEGRIVLRHNYRKNDSRDEVMETSPNLRLSSLSFSPDGSRLAGLENGRESGFRAWVWEVASPRKAPKVVALNRNVMLWRREREAVAGAGAGRAAWAVIPGEPDPAPRLDVDTYAYSPDGKFLAVATCRGSVHLKPLTKGRAGFIELPEHGHHSQGCGWTKIAFSPDGSRLAATTNEGRVAVWETARPGARPVILSGKRHGQGSGIMSLTFTASGDELATVAMGGPILVWRIRTEDLAEAVCRRAGSNLSREDWNHFVGRDVPYQNTCPALPTEEEFMTHSSGQ